ARLDRCVPVGDPETLRLLQSCQRMLRTSQSITILQTDAVESPAVYGLFRNRLLLPQGILEDFPEAELRFVFLHELAHLKRRDLELNWLVTVLQLVHWFNPILWFAFRKMRADRELATDALVLASVEPKETAPYGETILRVVERLAQGRTLPNL